jgi:hypothetical protein
MLGVADNKVLTADLAALVDRVVGVAEVMTEKLFAPIPADNEPVVVLGELLNTDEVFKRLAVDAAGTIEVHDIAERILVTPFVLHRF